MEAVPRMPMIWLELKEAGEFEFSPTVRQVRLLIIQPVAQQFIDSIRNLYNLVNFCEVWSCYNKLSVICIDSNRPF